MEEYEKKTFPKKFLASIYAGVAALGVAIYVGWGLLYGSWNILDWENSGIYATTVCLVGIGIVGVFLYSLKDEDEE